MDETNLECPSCGTTGSVNNPNIPRPSQKVTFHKYGENATGRQKYKCRECGRIFTGTKKGRPKNTENDDRFAD